MKFAVFVSLLVIIPFQAEAGSCINKNLELHVAFAEDLSGDGLFDPDPYVVVTIGKETRKTRVIHDDPDPVWWERFNIPKITSDKLKIEVWEVDGGLRGGDDHLGTCVKPLTTEGHFITCNTDSGYVRLYYSCY